MSDQATGGDGSVWWSVDADAVRPGDTQDNHLGGNPGPHHQQGISQDGNVGEWFTVSIKVPAGFANAGDYLNAIVGQDPAWGVHQHPRERDRVYLNVRIEARNHDQIMVSWGNSPFVVRPGQRER